MKVSIRNDERGISLLGTTVGLGVASLMMMAMIDASAYSARAQRSVSMTMDFDGLTETLRRTVAFEPTCTPALLGESTSEAMTIKDPLDAKNVLAAPGRAREIGFTLTHVELRDVTAVPGKAETFRGTLYVEARKDMRLALGAPILSRRIGEVYFESAGGDGKISRCYGVDSLTMTAESTCLALGGQWVNRDGQGLQCVLQQAGQAPETPKESAQEPAKEPVNETGKEKEKDHDNNKPCDDDSDHDLGGGNNRGWGN